MIVRLARVELTEPHARGLRSLRRQHVSRASGVRPYDAHCSHTQPFRRIHWGSVPGAALVDSYAFAFLDYFLGRRTDPLLWGNGAGLARYRHSPPPASARSRAIFALLPK